MAESIEDIRGQKIKELVAEMKLYNNPKELEEIRKVMRKNVSLSMRGYLMAYLYMTRYEEKGHSSNQYGNRHNSKKQESAVKAPIEDAVSFYINIGKTSKTSPKELAEFICENAHINSSDILSIAYKPNYSFVYIKKNVSDGVIEAINGQSYKGRKVKINYSKD